MEQNEILRRTEGMDEPLSEEEIAILYEMEE